MTRRSSSTPRHDKRYPSAYYDVEQWSNGGVAGAKETWHFIQGHEKLHAAKIDAVKRSLKTGRGTRVVLNGKEVWNIAKARRKEIDDLVHEAT